MTPLTLALLGFGFALLCVAAPFLSRFLCHAWRLEKPNFAGNVIPAATGMTFLIIGAAVYGSLPASGATLGFAYAPSFLMVCVGFGLLGLYDDKYGSREVSGFKGHIGSLLKGKPTTGAIKLVVGGVLALLAAFLVHRNDWGNLLVTATIIALGANTLNLLDTRPGRAQFGFFALFALPVTAATFVALYKLRYIQPGMLPDDVRFYTPAGVLLGPLIVAAAVEWWSDARGKAMMGDTGSNLLGATGALAAAVSLPLSGRITLLLVLVAFNVLTERFSWNAVIEKNRFLRSIDRALGVRAQ
jgi:UDP-N-acetylmuramyl pentapeptide phosphotransferase/UDP-N-acetylglucosamine-1-phosphate transferase